MTKISILGCGWLGIPLAKALVEKGFLIAGSTTSTLKLSLLESIGITPFMIMLEANEIQGEVTTFLHGSDIVIIDIPPKLRGNSKGDFVGKIKNLVPYLEKAGIKKVLFVSSTSVYPDTNETITEATRLRPETESGKQLLQAEAFLLENRHFQTTVLRFGGLIGEDRNPIHFLAGRTSIENPNAPINLIHQEDCIGIILKIIDSDFWGETFNAVSPFHPTREHYYCKKAKELGLDLPTFDHSKPSIGKLISSEKIETVVGYQFKKRSLQ
jgi:nucleoside-diphosphate-sugar epimerase